MRVVITGASGFIGKNLQLRLSEMEDIHVETFSFVKDEKSLESTVEGADWVVHLAGVNRPEQDKEFETGNVSPLSELCSVLESHNPSAGIILSSSTQVDRDNAYGHSKLSAENVLEAHSEETKSRAKVFRLSNVFGKWCKPNYNSAVATFCHNIANGLPIEIHNADAKLNLVYIDDVIDSLIAAIQSSSEGFEFLEVSTSYELTVGELAQQIEEFSTTRIDSNIARVGSGIVRVLYSTYISYLDPSQFAYTLESHSDERGEFTEILKTSDSGQFSYFTAHPGVTRGGHYHHTKTEKFLVVSGQARFAFRHMLTEETHEIEVDSTNLQIVETIPGWVHDITNIGDSELLVLLWANEVFDPDKPDTIAGRTATIDAAKL